MKRNTTKRKILSPGHNPVNECPLFFTGFGQIDAGGFNALMTHQVCQQGNIIKLCQKIFCKAVAEGVRIHRFLRDSIFSGGSF